MLVATLIWAVLLLAYVGKWIWARPQALAEFHHPVLCCFIGLVPAFATSTVCRSAAVEVPYRQQLLLSVPRSEIPNRWNSRSGTN